MDNLLALVLAFVGGGGLAAVIVALFGRRRERAGTRQVTAEAVSKEQQTEQSLTEWYREQVKELTKEMRQLKADFASFREEAQTNTEQYQRQAVSLFDKIDTMSIDLARANKTIDELREEVKNGNRIITQLRNEITKLLIDKAEKKE